MQDQSLSVYRGQSREGIGEGPGEKVPHGEQFLDADPSLCDKQILDGIRHWMTLSLDPLDLRSLGERLESWSYFALEGYCWVVRLTPAGKYDDRAAYFSHGRAWKSGLLRGGFDPGVYLGDCSVFDRPWQKRPSTPTQLSRLPGLIRMEQVAQQRQMACQLLAHLLEAVRSNGHLLLSAPLESFAQGAPLQALVCFARAALPERLKKECRIRVYTRRSKLFLEQLGCHLVAVPQDEADELRIDQPNLAILDASGCLQRGQPPCQEALHYARTVTDLACRLPANLLLFSSRADGWLDGQGAFKADFPSLLPRLYALCDPDPDGRQQAVLQSLQQNEPSPQPGLLQPEDFLGFTAQALARILLAGLLSPRWGSLQQMACQALAAPEFPQARLQEVGSLLQTNLEEASVNRSGGAIHLQGLAELVRAGLIPQRQAGAVSFQSPLRALSGLDDPSPLLEAEIQSGFFDQRGLSCQQLAELAAHPQAVGALVNALLAQRLPSDWAPAFLCAAPPQAALAFAGSFLADPDALQKHSQVADALLERLLELPQLPPSLHPLLGAAMHGLDPIQDLPLCLTLVELRCRSADPGWKAPLLKIWPRLQEVKEARQRRWLIGKALSQEWKSLLPSFLYQEKEGRLRLDPAWLRDVADQLAADDEVVSHLSLSWLARLAACLPASGAEAQRERLASAIDSLAEKDPSQLPAAMAELQQSRIWPCWKAHSRLPDPLKRHCAQAWLSGAWKAAAVIEDWDAAIDWLGDESFSPREIEQMAAGWGSARPWAGFFQFQQMRDLARRCAGLDALASLFDLARREQQPFPLGPKLGPALISASPLADWGLPDDFFDHLLGRATQCGLVLEERALEKLHGSLADVAESRRENLRQALRRGALDQLQDRFSQAIRTARWLELEFDPAFRSALARILAAQIEQDTPPAAKDLDFLDKWLSLTSQPIQEGRFERAARFVLAQGFESLAAFLSPDARQAGLLQRAVRTLLRPDGGDEDCWQELLNSAEGGRNGDNAHPVARLARYLRQIAAPKGSPALGRQSWTAFCNAAARHPGLIGCSPQQGAVLPALELASVLADPSSSPAKAAFLVAKASQASLHSQQESWWEQLFRGLPGPSAERFLMELEPLWRNPSGQRRLDAACKALQRSDGPPPGPAPADSNRHEWEQSP